ncbi:hypothetical protein [Comamonas fluminis]|uniref:hypothetical protein n=1 Tax=Comamonas fluminis TaxID=2796366 RepID=UPI001C473817|nr:hypothetical protein [Comamonas fluminis]
MNSIIGTVPFYIKPSESMKNLLITDDSEAGLVLNATNKFIPNLPQKLENIFTESIKSIQLTERNYRKQIIEVLPFSNIIDEISFSEKIRLLGEKKFIETKPHNKIQAAYVSLFNNIQELISDYSCINQLKQEQKENHPNIYNQPIEIKIINSFYNKSYLSDPQYQNLIISRIFSIQIIFLELLNSHKNAVNKTERKNIAKYGGNVKNYGEHILLENINDYFSKNRPIEKDKSPSIAHMHKKHYENIELILNEFQSQIGTQEEGSRKIIYYGSNLRADGLLRKIREWVKKDKKLKKEIEEFHLKYKVSHKVQIDESPIKI